MRVSWGEEWPVAAVAAAAVVMITPLWVVSMPAMPDFPAHLASFYLIAGGAKLPVLAQFYRIEWAAIPNLAAETLVPILGAWIGFLTATKLLLSAAVALWVIGPALVQRALTGRVGIGAIAAAFFAYNVNYLWGFFNFDFAAGLSFAVFAAWIATRNWPPAARIPIFALGVLTVYFSHVFAAAILLVLIGGLEATLWWDEQSPRSVASALRRVWPIAAIFIVPAVLFFFFKPPGTDGHVAFNLLTTWQDRIEAFLDLYFDDPYYTLLAALTVLFVLGVWRGWIVVHRLMWLALIVLALGSLFAPEEAMGGWGVDLRTPPIFAAMLFAASEVTLPRRVQGAIGVVLMGIVVFNAMALAGNWRYYDRRFAEFRAADALIPRGAKIVTVLDGDSIGKASDQPYWHMAEYAIIDRSVFTPLLFTTKGQHVVRLQPGLEAIAATSARQGSPPDISELDDLAHGFIDGDTDIEYVFPYLMRFQCHFDEVVLVHLNGHRSAVPDTLRLRHAGSFFALYDVLRKGCPAR